MDGTVGRRDEAVPVALDGEPARILVEPFE
jgi:hypothetical protein